MVQLHGECIYQYIKIVKPGKLIKPKHIWLYTSSDIDIN